MLKFLPPFLVSDPRLPAFSASSTQPPFHLSLHPPVASLCVYLHMLDDNSSSCNKVSMLLFVLASNHSNRHAYDNVLLLSVLGKEE